MTTIVSGIEETPEERREVGSSTTSASTKSGEAAPSQVEQLSSLGFTQALSSVRVASEEPKYKSASFEVFLKLVSMIFQCPCFLVITLVLILSFVDVLRN